MRTVVLLRSVLVFAFSAPLIGAAQSTTVALPGSEVTFDIDARSAKIDDHLGRRALFLRAQTPPAFASGIEFVDGTIEFDLAAMPNGNFVGLIFRYENPLHHENIYFRLHRSGSFEAVQYAPRVNSAAGSWQLYREFMAPAALPVGTWVRVRADVSDKGMTLFVGDSTKPLIVVPRMRGTARSGRVGFWGRVNDRPDEWTAAISNVRVRSVPATPPAGIDTVQLPEGTLTGWQIAGPYEAPDSTKAPPLPRTDEWSPIPIEEGGLLNISKRLAKPAGGRHVAFLRNTLRAREPEVAVLEVGYSDDAMIWLNGSLLFRGSNGFNSRYPGFLGLIGNAAEHVYLPLRQGENTLIVAVAERAFGWGLKARIRRP